MNKFFLTSFFCLAYSMATYSQNLCISSTPCIKNYLNSPVNVYLQINGSNTREDALYDLRTGNIKSSLGAKDSAEYRLKDMIRTPSNPSGQLLKALKVIFVLKQMPVSDDGKEGVIVTLGKRDLVGGQITRVPHHFEFIKNDQTGFYEAIIHFRTPGFLGAMDHLKKILPEFMEDFKFDESDFEKLYLREITSFFNDLDPTVKHPGG